MPTFKSLSIEFFQSWEDHSSNIFQHKFETFGNTSWTTMTLRREEKLWKKLFLFSTHRARFYLDPHTLVLFFYFVQLVWESWFDGDKRWNGSLGRIRASQASDTEVNVTQGARLTFPYHRPVKKPDFHHLDSRWRSFQTFFPRKNYPSFNLRALTSLARSHFPD